MNKLVNRILSHFKPETQSTIIGTILLVGIICLGIALSAMLGGCTQYCCSQCRANHDDLNYTWEEVYKLKCAVRDMKRGYRTIPVKVSITNAWEVAR